MKTLEGLTGNLKPIKTLICCCCGQSTKGRQWWNRDTGYGLCNNCIECCKEKRDEDGSEFKSCYGINGIHYNLEESK